MTVRNQRQLSGCGRSIATIELTLSAALPSFGGHKHATAAAVPAE